MTSRSVRSNYDNSEKFRCKERGDLFGFLESFLEPFLRFRKAWKHGRDFLEARSSVVQRPVPLTKVVAKRVSEVVLPDNVVQWEDPSLEAAVDQRTVARNIVCAVFAIRKISLFAFATKEKDVEIDQAERRHGLICSASNQIINCLVKALDPGFQQADAARREKRWNYNFSGFALPVSSGGDRGVFEVINAAFETTKKFRVVRFFASAIDIQSLTENNLRFRSMKYNWIY